jgi:hypothetical protein
VLAAIDIHKAVFQAAVLDHGSGALVEERFAASREALAGWAHKPEPPAGEIKAGPFEAVLAATGAGPWNREEIGYGWPEGKPIEIPADCPSGLYAAQFTANPLAKSSNDDAAWYPSADVYFGSSGRVVGEVHRGRSIVILRQQR